MNEQQADYCRMRVRQAKNRSMQIAILSQELQLPTYQIQAAVRDVKAAALPPRPTPAAESTLALLYPPERRLRGKALLSALGLDSSRYTGWQDGEEYNYN